MSKALPAARIATALLVALLSCSANTIAPGSRERGTPSERRSLIGELRQYAYPLSSAYPDNTATDLTPISRAVGSAKLIAMGEATHGTGDFFAIKDRVFRFLANHDGVRVLATEADWANGALIDNYLQTGNGNLRNILIRWHYYPWGYQEMFNLLQWMRQYNEAHPHALHFFGMDMQQPDTAIPYILSFYRTADPSRVDAIAQDLSCINKPTMVLFSKALSNATQCIDATRAVVQQLIDERQRQTIADRGTYLTAFHAAELAEEAAIEYEKSNIEQKAATRDLAMAHNVEWLSTTLYPESKVFIWAHNDHIAVGLEAWPSMGTLLRESYGAHYFAIGQTFDHGKVAQAGTAAADVSPAATGTSEAMFREARLPLFFLDFHAVPHSTALGQWLAQPQSIRSLGGNQITSADAQNEMTTVLPHAFDALIFIYETRAARWLLPPPISPPPRPPRPHRAAAQHCTLALLASQSPRMLCPFREIE